jgi:hypothetical protein
MNIPNVNRTGNRKKVGDRYYPEIHCSLCGETRNVKEQGLEEMKNCPACHGLGTIENRIKNRGKFDEITGCINWFGCHTKDGYAIIGSGKKRIRVAKFLLEKKLGRSLLSGHETCHTCNNRNCVNVEHLYEGTHKQNGIDMANRGILKGKNAKINYDEARRIKQLISQKVKSKQIQKETNTPKTIISHIRYGNSWAWV